MRIWHIALLASLLAPFSAQAYLGPDQVIFSDEFAFPPRPSAARERVLQQNQASVDRRTTVYQELAAERDAAKAAAQPEEPTEVSSSFDTNTVANQIAALLATLQNGGHAAAPSYDQIQWTPVDDPSDPLAGVEWEEVGDTSDGQSMDDLLANGNLDPATERLLKRLQTKKEEEQFAGRYAGMVEQYHSGAPLADTGAGTTISVLLLLAAGAWTILRACRKGMVEVRWN